MPNAWRPNCYTIAKWHRTLYTVILQNIKNENTKIFPYLTYLCITRYNILFRPLPLWNWSLGRACGNSASASLKFCKLLSSTKAQWAFTKLGWSCSLYFLFSMICSDSNADSIAEVSDLTLSLKMTWWSKKHTKQKWNQFKTVSVNFIGFRWIQFVSCYSWCTNFSTGWKLVKFRLCTKVFHKTSLSERIMTNYWVIMT